MKAIKFGAIIIVTLMTMLAFASVADAHQHWKVNHGPLSVTNFTATETKEGYILLSWSVTHPKYQSHYDERNSKSVNFNIMKVVCYSNLDPMSVDYINITHLKMQDGRYHYMDKNISRPSQFGYSNDYYYSMTAQNRYGSSEKVYAVCYLQIYKWKPIITSMPNTTAYIGEFYDYPATFNDSNAVAYYFMVYPDWFMGFNVGGGVPDMPGVYEFAIMAQLGGDFGFGDPAVTTWQYWNVTVLENPNL